MVLDLNSPVSAIMTKNVISVLPTDSLNAVKEFFATHRSHHLPVVEDKKMLGMISKSDFLAVSGGLGRIKREFLDEEAFLTEHTAAEIMVTGLAKLEPTSRINVAVNLFALNYFHALPVFDNDELVGIITTHDIIKFLDTLDDIQH
jgi:CBS domain-containing protein